MLAHPSDKNSPITDILASVMWATRVSPITLCVYRSSGDLLITQESKLEWGSDVFTAGTLRPLLKPTLYAEQRARHERNLST